MRWRAICERRFERVIGDRTGLPLACGRGCAAVCTDNRASERNLFEQIAQIEHIVQIGALRRVPGGAGVPRQRGREAPSSTSKPNPRPSGAAGSGQPLGTLRSPPRPRGGANRAGERDVNALRRYCTVSREGAGSNGHNGHFFGQPGRDHLGTSPGGYGSGFNGPRAVLLFWPTQS